MVVYKGAKRGFTLIELLIVIVIIGVLATTVLSAINPIEQIKKAQDAGKRSDSAEVLNALERYYTAFEAYPWSRDPTTVNDKPPKPGTSTQEAIGVTNAQGEIDVKDWITDSQYGLIAAGELKSEFTGRENLTDIYVFWDSDEDLVRVCFKPESKTNQSQAKWFSDGVKIHGASTTCTTDCYQCVPE